MYSGSSSVSFGQVPNYVPTNELVGWWGFNGNADDESGNGNNGNPVNNPSLSDDRFGNPNSVYEFAVDGAVGWGSAQQYIDVPFDEEFNSNELTFASWVYPRTKPSPYDNRALSIFSRWNLAPANFRYQVGDTNTVQILLNDDANTDILTTSAVQLVPFNQWSHVAATYDGNICKLYVNGITVKSDTINIQLMEGPSTLTIGQTQMSNGNWLFFDGFLDELGYWSVALDSCEIKDLYEGSLGNCCAPNPITTQPTDVTVPLNGSGMFSTSTSVTSPTYQWQMDNGTGYMDLTNAGQFSGVDTDMLTVSNVTLGQNNTLFRCIVTENSNCSDTTDVAVLTVEDNTGLDDLNKNIFNVYPNPTTNSFTISSDNLINSEFKIIDAQGREVLTGSMNGQEHTIDISKLSKGVYSVVFDNTEYPVVSVIKE